MADPFREQRIAPREVRRALARACALAEEDPETPDAERSLTRVEIERAAADLGLPRSAVARAFERGADPDVRRFEVSGFLGAPTRLVYEADLDGEPTEEDREDALDLIASVTGEMGSMTPMGKTLTWQTTGQQGRGRQISVRMRTRDGRTRLVIEERLSAVAVGLFLGLGVGGGVGPMGGYISAVVKLGVLGLIFPLVWIPLMYLLARRIYIALVRRREKQLLELFERLSAASSRWRKSARVRVPTASTSADATEEEEEAAAEEEAREAGKSRV